MRISFVNYKWRVKGIKSKSWGKNKKAFTFLEILLALFCLGLISFSIQSLFITFRSYNEEVQASSQLDFNQFLVLLEKELSGMKVTTFDRKTLYLEDPHQLTTYRIVCQKQKIYKADGHHPLLYDVQDWQVSIEEDFLHLAVRMLDQAIYQGSIKIDVD